jgi:hypothetical protein
MCPTPKAKRLDNMPPMEFPANQIPIRTGISSRVYHVEVKNINPGVIVASATPSKNRTVMRPPKLVHTAVIATTIPQKNVLTVRYLAVGSRAIRIVVGYSQIRYPK